LGYDFGFEREFLSGIYTVREVSLLAFSCQGGVAGLVGLSMVLGSLLRGRYLETRQWVPMRKTPLRRRWSQIETSSSITRSERCSRFPRSSSRHRIRTSRICSWGMPASFSRASQIPNASSSSPRSPSYDAASEMAGRSCTTTPCHGTSSSSSGRQFGGGSKLGIILAQSLIWFPYSRSWAAVNGAAVWMTRLPDFVMFAPAILLWKLVPRKATPLTAVSRCCTKVLRAMEEVGIG
jgi:hypothetical protein